jgi:glucans biosynthesis protein
MRILVSVSGSAPLARALLALASAAVALASGRAAAFGLEDVERRAQALASSPYRPPATNLPDSIRHLTYDQHRDIRFRPDRALWRGERLGFEVMFFHPGWSFTDPVTIHEVTSREVRDLVFDPSAFDYGHNQLDPGGLRGLGFAGFRVHFPLNRPEYRDEVLVFLGASYFRALGSGQRYGASARGLAIDTALPSGEEFPRFVEFWLVRPASGARELTVYALLDSPRLAGAYRFVLRPGRTTTVDVRGVLFARAQVGKLGVAPLTSMFFFGSNAPATREDYRPEVHDSDGLSVQARTGEWLWRPLLNPKRLVVTSFAMSDAPLGFGLMQRERRFARYEDLEARYDLRPSIWIVPEGSWGPGRLELVELPVPDETNDNVVAYWVPDRVPGPGERLELRYRTAWQAQEAAVPLQAWVGQTLRGAGYVRPPDRTVELHVDFVGPALRRLPPDAAVEGVVTADGNGELVEEHTVHNDVTGGWRVSVRVRRRDEGKPVELRAFVRDRAGVVSETWSYILPPD